MRDLSSAAALLALVAATLVAPPAVAEPATAPLAPLAAAGFGARPRPAPDDEWRQLRFTGGVSLTGIGLLSVLLGGVLGARALVSRNDIGTHCDAAHQCDLMGYALGAEATDFSLISTITIAAGLGLTGVGIGLLVSATPKKPGAAAWIRPSAGGVVAGARW